MNKNLAKFLKLDFKHIKGEKLTFIEKIKYKYYKLEDWVHCNIINNIVYMYEGIVRVFIYMPIVYKDRDWDHSFISNLMLFKLKLMLKHYKTDKRICIVMVDKRKVIKSLKEAITLLEKIHKDDYIRKYSSVKKVTTVYKLAAKEKEKDLVKLGKILKDNYEFWWW